MPTNLTLRTVDTGKVKGRNQGVIFRGLSVGSHRSRLECCSSEGGQAETAAHMVSPATRCSRAVRYGSTRALPRRKYQLWALAGSGTFYSEPQHHLNSWLVTEERVCLQTLLQREENDVTCRGGCWLQQLLTAKHLWFWGDFRSWDDRRCIRGPQRSLRRLYHKIVVCSVSLMIFRICHFLLLNRVPLQLLVLGPLELYPALFFTGS